MVGDRCPECGQVIDREALRVSSVPWAHRRELGRVRAYLSTARQIAWDAKALRHEAAKPQDPQDAAAFHRVTGTILTVTALASFAAVWISAGGYGGIAPPRLPPGAMANGAPPGWVQDLIAPWSAGATLPLVLPACLAGMAFHLAGVQRTVFRGPWTAAAGPSIGVRRRSAVALASYLSAPLLLLPIAVAVVAAVPFAASVAPAKAARLLDQPKVMGFVGVAAAGLVFAAVLGTLVRVGVWVARTTRGGPAAVARGVGELVVLWLLGGAAWLVVLPWCVGLAWVLIDALR
ncbi:MAG: hypothetical protein JWO31_4135 [Phycisphaerales bacterium]|nr:hypothetical protein [Phycisphaerales bacterium]